MSNDKGAYSMPYSELIEYMHKYRNDEITKPEMMFAFMLWKESL